MKKNIAVITLATTALFAGATAIAETVITTEALKAGGVRVTGYVVEAIEPAPVVCPDLRWDAFDLNQDGVLDTGCVGLSYNACEGKAPDYNAWFAAGNVCLSEPLTPVGPVFPPRTDCVEPGQLTTGAPVCVD